MDIWKGSYLIYLEHKKKRSKFKVLNSVKIVYDHMVVNRNIDDSVY
jgi:hypothetical protein